VPIRPLRCPQISEHAADVFVRAGSQQPPGFVILVCAGVGTVFEISGQLRGEHIGWLRGEPEIRAKCRGLRYEDFRHATAEEIQHLGFRPGSYR
jgi:hypothetical protein